MCYKTAETDSTYMYTYMYTLQSETDICRYMCINYHTYLLY